MVFAVVWIQQSQSYSIRSLSNDEGDGNENGQKAIGLDPVYMGWGTPVQWGKFLLFCVPQSVKTKETNPSRPGSPTPCKQALSYIWQNNNFARASRFFVHFQAVAARQQLESAKFQSLSRTRTLIHVFQNSTPQKFANI